MTNRISQSVQRRIARAGRRLREGRVPGRGVEVFSDDAFVVSYPRSGNTWLRFLIADLQVADPPTSFLNVEERVPDIYVNGERRLGRLPRPRILKSHEPLDARYPRVVYAVRDPRDVAASYFHFLVKIRALPDGRPSERYVRAFLDGSLDTYGSWPAHVRSWVGARRADETFLLVRYEDLVSDTRGELVRIARFLGLDSSEDHLERAVSRTTPERMRVREAAEGSAWSAIRGSREDRPFLRSATSGAGRAELPPEAAAMIEAECGDVMRELGYLQQREAEARR